jgi:hypothetical protein
MSKRTIALFVLATAVAAILTVEMTYLILGRFVLHNPSDPLTKADGLSPAQDPTAKGSK